MSRGTLSSLAQYNHFEVVRELGRTSHGAVYLVWDVVDARYRAVKLFEVSGRAQMGMLRRFARETRVLARLDHPNVLRVHRTGLVEGRPYLVTEYAEGGSLEDWVRAHGRVPAPMAAELVAQVARAVDAAHRVHLVHGNLKPSNLLLSARGPLVGDFGVAATLAAANPPTQPDDVGFLAPEHLEGQPPDPPGDVYGLGATLFSLVTGRAPERDARRDLPIAELPPALRPIVLQACDGQPPRRHPHLAALAADLERVVPQLRVPEREQADAPQAGPPDATGFGRTVVPEAPEPASTPLQALRRLWGALTSH